MSEFTEVPVPGDAIYVCYAVAVPNSPRTQRIVLNWCGQEWSIGKSYIPVVIAMLQRAKELSE